MTLRFASQTSEWTETMKCLVRDQLVEAAENHLGSSRFDMSAHLNDQTGSNFELWLVLQSHDNQRTEILRGQGPRFADVVENLRDQLSRRLRLKEAL